MQGSRIRSVLYRDFPFLVRPCRVLAESSLFGIWGSSSGSVHRPGQERGRGVMKGELLISGILSVTKEWTKQRKAEQRRSSARSRGGGCSLGRVV